MQFQHRKASTAWRRSTGLSWDGWQGWPGFRRPRVPAPRDNRLGIVGKVAPDWCDRRVLRISLVRQPRPPMAVGQLVPALDIARQPAPGYVDPDPPISWLDARPVAGRGRDRVSVTRHNAIIERLFHWCKLSEYGGCYPLRKVAAAVWGRSPADS